MSRHFPSLPRVIIAVALLIAGMVTSAAPVRAADITVNTTDDELNADGDCSLREAITAANTDAAVDACTAGSGADTITLGAGVYALSLGPAGDDSAATGDLDITDDLTIVGLGSDGTTDVDGTALDRVFHVVGTPTVVITELTIRNGLTGAGGGGVRNEGTLTLDRVGLTGNQGFNGGALQTVGDTTVSNSFLQQNTADQDGGAISHTVGTLTVTDSTFFDNLAVRFGGAILNSATALLTDVSIDTNNAGDDGGAIYNSGEATLTGVQIASGNTGIGDGGGLFNEAGGTLTLTNATIGGNFSYAGAGIANEGTLVMTDSAVTNNDANDPGPLFGGGGGIQNVGGDVTITGSTIANNTSEGTGAGINNFGGLTVTDSAVTDNTTDVAGGGIYNQQTATLKNVTISTNSSGAGGGLDNINGAETTLTNVTIARNNENGIVNAIGVPGEAEAGVVNAVNTIVSDNGPADCSGEPLASAGHNLDSDDTCGLAAAGDLPAASPQLQALALNAPGATETHALTATSPAVDAGAAAACPSADQRGVSRPQDGDVDGTAACDIGAYELVGAAPTPTLTPTPVPIQLPPTGGEPLSGADGGLTLLALAAGAIALAGAGGALVAVRRRR